MGYNEMRDFIGIILVMSLSFFTSSLSYSQNLNSDYLIDTAIDLAEQELFDEAIQMIEPVLLNEAKDNARAWYVAGYSHKGNFKREVYTGSSTSVSALSERRTAVSQLIKAYEIDSKVNTTPTSISTMALDALEYLSKTYMNDVVSGVRGFTRGMDDEILGYFNEFLKIRRVINKNEDWRSEEVEVEKNLARANRLLLENTTTDSEELFARIIGHYNRAIELDGDDYTSRYNLAINLYNRGVARLKSIDHTTVMFELMEIQDACVELFEKALNPMLAAHSMFPERKETLRGLMTIYKALSNEEESDKYQRALEEVVKEDGD
jgi:tetratricopeptide (TPR) repeat protein